MAHEQKQRHRIRAHQLAATWESDGTKLLPPSRPTRWIGRWRWIGQAARRRAQALGPQHPEGVDAALGAASAGRDSSTTFLQHLCENHCRRTSSSLEPSYRGANPESQILERGGGGRTPHGALK